MSSTTSQPPPEPSIPWQVIDLVANNLDPKTLATAACVSKSWYSTMSSDHRWEHLCISHFPTLQHLRSIASPPLPYHRLYNIASTASKRRQRTPKTPKITLNNLIFIITLNNPKSETISIIRTGTELELDHKPLFRFDFDVRDRTTRKWLKLEVSDETTVTWNIVLRGFEGVFTMMDCKGKGSFISGSDGWFSAELPSSGCCCASSCGTSSGMVSEMRLVIKEEEGGGEGRRTVVGSVNVGVLSVVSWRYVSVDNCLRYLQHFFEPFNV
ncbi:putative F-box protein At5g04010 [Bidens hawaiensis]|uniref:putative F-box protein At5g04010 n=1 Tax=Bidens hawaiensis TaxID=980011 RepID=UPI00404A3621